MQLQTQLNNIPLKLNCSSIASSTPGNNQIISFPSGQLVNFQQFTNNQNIQQPKTDRSSFAHKKRLTIQINDSYDFNPSSVEHSELAIGVESVQSSSQNYTNEKNNNCFFKKDIGKNYDEQKMTYTVQDSLSPSFANSNSQIDIERIISLNILLEEKLKRLQHQNGAINIVLEQQKQTNTNLKAENDHLKAILKKKDELIVNQKERCLKLTEKLNQLEEQKTEHKFYDEKLRQKQIKYTQLQKKNQKLSVMNKALQKQLKQSDKKILQLQKQIQKTFCQIQHQAINRIKQSSLKIKEKEPPIRSKELQGSIANKQNLNHNVMMQNTMNNNAVNKGSTNLMGSTVQLRKSIEKKKGSMSQGKKKLPGTISMATSNAINIYTKPQRASSSSNIVSKKLLMPKKE